MKKTAFTLAETLIVMGVIGVVAALTLPNLNSSTSNKEKVAKLQKIYSNLQDAFGRAEAVYGPYDEWFVNDGNDNNKRTKRTFERITEFMKYSKVCTINDNCTLFNSGNTSSEGARARHAVILADGTTIGFNRDIIYIDIDGFNKGQNIAGKDYFYLRIIGNPKTINIGSSHLIKDSEPFDCFNNAGEYTTWVLTNGNMDYLKTINNKCPDGQKLQFGVKTSCK